MMMLIFYMVGGMICYSNDYTIPSIALGMAILDQGSRVLKEME